MRERLTAANNLADNTDCVCWRIRHERRTAGTGRPIPGSLHRRQRQSLFDGVLGEWFDGDGNSTTMNTKGASEFTTPEPTYLQVANIQIDAVFNKVGYHYPQERIIALWDDVEATINKQRPPEPLVMRFNTFDCGKLLHSNLVPHEYELDDFQVRTPTDIIGQHIHLPKWDLTTNDGAANGWNYEDGALSPGIVKERILAINHFNEYAGTIVPAGTLPGQLAPIDLTDLAAIPTIDTGDPGSSNFAAGLTHLTAAKHPFFAGAGANVQTHLYDGARTVIQRILIDPVVNVAGVDRGLGLTFSHDHYGPSTFQQIGLYSTILAEPAGSTWVHNETGDTLGGRTIADPTCTVRLHRRWPNQLASRHPAARCSATGQHRRSELIKDHREFYFEMSDFQHAYEPGVYVGADANGIPKHHNIIQPDPFNATMAEVPELQNSWRQAVNPPLKLKSVPFPDVVTANTCVQVRRVTTTRTCRGRAPKRSTSATARCWSSTTATSRSDCVCSIPTRSDRTASTAPRPAGSTRWGSTFPRRRAISPSPSRAAVTGPSPR